MYIENDESKEANVLLEQECEAQLLHLELILNTLEAKAQISEPTRIELKEIYEMSKELYLKSEYSLALSLIDDAFNLIEKSAY